MVLVIGVLTANGPSERMKTGRLPHTVERLRQVADDIAGYLIRGPLMA